MRTKHTRALPRVVTPAKWQAAHEKLLAKEKAATRARDALAAERRRQPMVQIEKAYALRRSGWQGAPAQSVDEGRRQLIVYHFMFALGVDGWPQAGCLGCSFFVEIRFSIFAHLHARDTSFALVSRAPLRNIQRYKKRMGWMVPWFSSSDSDFNDDFGLTTVRRTNVGFDLTNVLNANPVLTYNEAFSTSTNTWLRPNSVLQPRLAKFSVQFNF